jgi:hypothetical protein
MLILLSCSFIILAHAHTAECWGGFSRSKMPFRALLPVSLHTLCLRTIAHNGMAVLEGGTCALTGEVHVARGETEPGSASQSDTAAETANL